MDSTSNQTKEVDDGDQRIRSEGGLQAGLNLRIQDMGHS
jgi:hypothetical protein